MEMALKLVLHFVFFGHLAFEDVRFDLKAVQLVADLMMLLSRGDTFDLGAW